MALVGAGLASAQNPDELDPVSLLLIVVKYILLNNRSYLESERKKLTKIRQQN